MSPTRRLPRSPLPATFLISGVVFLGLVMLRLSGNLGSFELAAYDWFVRLQPRTESPNPRIVLIGITEDDIREQQSWPLTDAKLAEALKIISSRQPRAIGLDIYRDSPRPPGLEELESIMRANRNIIVVMKLLDEIRPPPALANTEQVGFNDLYVDPGGTVRRGLLFMDHGGEPAYSFALRLALLYLQEMGVTLQRDPLEPEHVRIGQNTIRPFEANDGPYVGADAGGYQFLLDFKDAPGSFQFFSLTGLLSGKVPGEALHGKIVLIGTTAEGAKDFFYTPLSGSIQARQEAYGVELHAHILSQIVRMSLGESLPMTTLSSWGVWLWTLLWCVMGGLFGLWVRPPLRFSLGAAAGCLLLALAGFLAFLSARWIPVVPPAAGWLAAAAIVTAYMSNQEKRQRASLMQIFSQHVSPEIAEEIWRHRDQFLEGGRPLSKKLIATTMFSDLKGFTAASEKMDPHVLIDWLNTYLERMAQLVMEYGGIVNDYAGDGIKADFGVPFERLNPDEIGRDAINAVNCALAMEAELCRLNTLWQQQGLPSIMGLRIGINTGPVVAGTLGSAQRLKYTTIGHAVNTASRLESYDKEGIDLEHIQSHCRILVSEATLSCLGNRFKTEMIGEAKLKGQSESIRIYRVLGRQRESTENGLKKEEIS